MLSILIPNYEYNCKDLVTDLVELGQEITVPVEIIVLDDGSSGKIRNQIRSLKEMQGVNYLELEKNVGRAKARNHLAEVSKYEYLLFLDCDSKICRTDFLAKYITFIPSNCVIVGGRIYSETRPSPRFVLHWKYGRNREGSSGLFQSNNFMIPRQIFNKIRFDDKLASYGHEDTLFGWHLKNLEIPVQWVDNPVQHLGLEATEDFLKKQFLAITNLLKIKAEHPAVETKLTEVTRMLKKLLLHYPVIALFRMTRKYLVKLLETVPNLWLLDFFKIGYYLEKNSAKG